MKKFFVAAEWDEDAKVWYVSDSDVPGLATEADTVDALIEKLRAMIPEMLELNGAVASEHDSIPFSLRTDISGVVGHC